jgi:hypothetical protein
VTAENDDAADPNSEAKPSQAAAASSIGVGPAPLNISRELISGGNTAKFAIVDLLRVSLVDPDPSAPDPGDDRLPEAGAAWMPPPARQVQPVPRATDPNKEPRKHHLWTACVGGRAQSMGNLPYF